MTNIPSLVGMGHHALAHGSTSLGLGAMAQRGMEMKERECGWFDRQRSQSIHMQHNNRKWEKYFESDPPPSFYIFSKGF